MAKVLISLLGTGKAAMGDGQKNEYQSVEYLLDGKSYPGETLTAMPLIQKYGIEKVFLIGTRESMWDNVAVRMECDDDYCLKLIEHKDENRMDASTLTPLERQIDLQLGKEGSRCLLVDSGESDEELWSNFDVFMHILDTLDDGDELYLDITHLFRSLSVMSIILGEFGSINKNIRIGGVFYGMLKKGEPSLIIDMSIFFELLEWAKAIKYLKQYGSPESVSSNMYKLADTETAKAFKNFSEALMVSDVDAIMKGIKHIKGKLKLFENGHRITSLVLDELQSFIRRFDGKETNLSAFQLELSKFYLETKNYPMFYLTLTEAILSKVCELNKGLSPESEEDRNEAKAIIKEYKDTNKAYVREIYYKINGVRINIAHKTSNTSSHKRMAPKDVVANASDYLNRLLPFFKKKA